MMDQRSDGSSNQDETETAIEKRDGTEELADAPGEYLGFVAMFPSANGAESSNPSYLI